MRKSLSARTVLGLVLTNARSCSIDAKQSEQCLLFGLCERDHVLVGRLFLGSGRFQIALNAKGRAGDDDGSSELRDKLAMDAEQVQAGTIRGFGFLHLGGFGDLHWAYFF